MLTQARLKELLYYDPDLGWFMWINGWRCGQVAGCLNRALGYIIIGVDGSNYYAHRLAFLYMTGAFPKYEGDHKDRDKTNNCWLNLRPATKKQNQENGSTPRNNTSGVRGVYWVPKTRKWIAKLKHNQRSLHLGTFASKREAIESRLVAEKTYFTHAT